jgi:hypothetical protein
MDDQTQNQSGPKKHKISVSMFIAMLVVAAILDLISLIPGINIIVLGIGGAIFALWWWKLGLGLINPKKVVTYALGGVIEFIPIVSMLPGILFMAISMFVITRAEDATGINVTSQFSVGKKKPSRRSLQSGARKNIAAGTQVTNNKEEARSKTNTIARSKSHVKLPSSKEVSGA